MKCSKCKINKKEGHFYTKTICNKCYLQKEKEKEKKPFIKTCRKCKEEKNSINFGKNSNSKDGIGIYCKECLQKERDANKKPRVKNPNKSYYYIYDEELNLQVELATGRTLDEYISGVFEDNYKNETLRYNFILSNLDKITDTEKKGVKTIYTGTPFDIEEDIKKIIKDRFWKDFIKNNNEIYIRGVKWIKYGFFWEKWDEDKHKEEVYTFYDDEGNIIYSPEINVEPKKIKLTRQQYMLSDEWRSLKNEIYSERGHTCELCGIEEKKLEQKLHLHHMTYERLFNEDKEDLILLCESCHTNEHKKIKQSRTSVNNYYKINKIIKK